jgi:hypothetical protein
LRKSQMSRPTFLNCRENLDRRDWLLEMSRLRVSIKIMSRQIETLRLISNPTTVAILDFIKFLQKKIQFKYFIGLGQVSGVQSTTTTTTTTTTTKTTTTTTTTTTPVSKGKYKYNNKQCHSYKKLCHSDKYTLYLF